MALVTGGGQGIGRALARGLAAHGLAVAVLGRTPSALDETAESCRAVGADAVAVAADVTDSDAVRAALARAEQSLGPVDLLVNNAGRIDAAEASIVDADVDDLVGVIEVNLIGSLRVLHAVLPGMVERGRGRVLTVNSGFAYRPTPGYLGYSVSKAALARMTDLLSRDLDRSGVVLLDASPGLVRTAMTATMPMWQRMDDPPWGDAGALLRVATAFADGRLDALSGRFVHAVADDVDDLVARTEQIVARDARRLRLAPYGDDDPVR